MSIHQLLLTAIATLSPPEDIEQPDAEQPVDDQHFCCKSSGTDKDAKVGFGDGCTFAEKVHIAGCSAVLYCPGGYSLDNGVVSCPL